jgi:Flp pilus assembly protein TadG
MKFLVRDRRGSIMVELALTAGFLLMLFFGVVEVARLFEAASALGAAARAGALHGATLTGGKMDRQGIESAAAQAAPQLGAMRVTTAAFCACSNGATANNCLSLRCAGAQSYLSVSAGLQVNSVTRYFALPPSVTMRSTAVMRLMQ